jgi:methionyl-tRNA formyltransferase
MRIVILAPSVYSETACAMAVHLAETGYSPVGALALSTLNRKTLLRKLGQWGPVRVSQYARAKVFERSPKESFRLGNPYLKPFLTRSGKVFHTLRQVGDVYDFPVATCADQNAPDALAHLRSWSPDLAIFTGGNILRQPLLQVPRLGVLNVHLGRLPEVRGMSTPEWSLLLGVPPGITIHFMDAGIDTGPILQRFELADASTSQSMDDLRHRLIAFGIEKIAEVIGALDGGRIAPSAQTQLDRDRQYFVMHDRLRAVAAECLPRSSRSPVAEATHG